MYENVQHRSRSLKHSLSVNHWSFYYCLWPCSLGLVKKFRLGMLSVGFVVLVGEEDECSFKLQTFLGFQKEVMLLLFGFCTLPLFRLCPWARTLKLTFFYEIGVTVKDTSGLSHRWMEFIGIEAVCKNGMIEILLPLICTKTTGDAQ